MELLEGFHNRAAWYIEGMTARRAEYGEWNYPQVSDMMEAAGLWTIKEYTQRRQATTVEQVA